MLTWTRAVSLMPMTAITSMIRPIPTPMATKAHLFVELEPKTASTDGPRMRTSATVPMM